MAKYPAGAAVQAWVKPHEPSQAVLERSGSLWFPLAIAAGGVLSVASWEVESDLPPPGAALE